MRITLRDATRDRDVNVDAHAGATVSELAAALAEHAGVTRADVLFADRPGRLQAGDTITSCGLLTGDIVSLDGPVAARTLPTLGSGPPAATLVAMGGPAAGLRIGLAAGRYVVGRDRSADVPIADASMSRRHFAVAIDGSGSCRVSDVGSSNGTAIEGTGLAVDAEHALGADEAVEAGRSTFTCEPWSPIDESAARKSGAAILHNRQPRVSRGYEPPTLRVDPPPAAARAIRIPLVMAIVPMFMGGALYLLTKSPMMLMMCAMSPLMMIGSSLGERRSGRREHVEQLARFNASVESLDALLTSSRAEEQLERRAATPHAGDLVARAIDHTPDLWERRPTDKDFLDLRLGVADQPSIVSVLFAPGGDANLRSGVEEKIRAHETVPVVPVHVRPTTVGAIGVVGAADVVDGIARWIMVEFATLQSPRDVVITAALSFERSEDWSWLSWLPHVDHPASPLDGNHIAIGEQPARDLLRRLATIASDRRQESDGRKRVRRRTSIIVLIDEDVAPEAVVVDGLLDGCADIDIVAVWLGRERRHLPGGCGVIVEASSDRAVADVTWTAGNSVRDASVDSLGLGIAESIARSLAPVEDTTAGGAAASVPRSVALVELLDLVEPTWERIAARWRARHGERLDATVGVSADGPFSLDMRADGPHALVAGTTGAGKSELLQTLIAALAASHPPDRIAFLLVDYKGGAAFKDCVGLPHSVGMVTDLDEHQVHRALISLNAELKRREHVLQASATRDLQELERRDPQNAPPSLVIVIDEFATLAKEVPQFVDGVVDVAQRGRSLGVHLVLATQRPGTAVTENIRANTSLRLALRVAGTAESDDVIGAPDAARLPKSVPGRAIARTSPTELELFQAGYVGGRTSAGQASRPIEVRDVIPPAASTTQGGTPISNDEITDLHLLVEAIGQATTELGITPPGSPWLPPLGPAVALEDVRTADAPGRAAIGLVDEPQLQRQVPFELDLPGDGNLLIFGAGGSGKTTALRTIAVALARSHRPRELNIHGLDFAGRGLQALEALPHCGSVIPGDDEERVARLLMLLRRMIDTRSQLFADRRVANLADFQRSYPDEPMPRVVLLLDSYAGFLEIYERVDLGKLVEALPRIVADGRAAGVHVVITADRRAAVPSAVASLIAARLILRMGSDDEYQMLGLPARTVKGAVLPSGRGFLADGREVQIATVAGTTVAREEASALASLAERLAAETPERADAIRQLPRDVAASELPVAPQPLTATFALDDLDLAPVTASLADSHFLVVGPYRAGRSSALDTIAAGLRASTPDLTTHLLAPRRSWLVQGTEWDTVSRGVDECEAKISELLDDLLGAAGTRDLAPVLVVLDDAGELAESSVASSLDMLIKRGRDAHVRCLMSIETGQARHYATWIREIRKDGRGVLLDPNLDLDGELLGARLPRRTNAVFPPGRGYMVSDGRVGLVQVARRHAT
jgi:S-DNA-T family DNA segregation ATPase FtsK/SpoIIIE